MHGRESQSLLTFTEYTHLFSTEVIALLISYGRHWLQLCTTEALSSNLDQCSEHILFIMMSAASLPTLK